MVHPVSARSSRAAGVTNSRPKERGTAWQNSGCERSSHTFPNSVRSTVVFEDWQQRSATPSRVASYRVLRDCGLIVVVCRDKISGGLPGQNHMPAMTRSVQMLNQVQAYPCVVLPGDCKIVSVGRRSTKTLGVMSFRVEKRRWLVTGSLRSGYCVPRGTSRSSDSTHAGTDLSRTCSYFNMDCQCRVIAPIIIICISNIEYLS